MSSCRSTAAVLGEYLVYLFRMLSDVPSSPMIFLHEVVALVAIVWAAVHLLLDTIANELLNTFKLGLLVSV